MERKNSNYIYIVLVKALTGLGRFVRTFTNYEYTHIAFCYDEQLSDFITFSRKKHSSPFESGFMHETLDCYAFGNNKEVKLKVFKIKVDNKSLKDIKEFVDKIENDNEYIFNIYSMATMSIFHGFRIYKAHNCMSFISRVIELSGIELNKKYFKYNIKEIDNLLTPYFYEERIFKKEKIENIHYMEKVGMLKNIRNFLILNGKLIKRIITKRNDYNE